MKRILLINPSYQPHWSRCEPTGLIQLATFLETKGFTCEILDLNVEKINYKHLNKLLSKYNPFLIGISALTCQAENAYSLGNLIKGNFPDKKIVYGGIHPTFMPEEAFEKGNADYVIIGEGEVSFPELAENVYNGDDIYDVPGIVFKKDDKLIKNERKCFPDINQLPIPDYSKVPLKRYNTDIHVPKFEKLLTVHVMTSRGCPGNCEYCASPALYQRKVRYRDVDKVVDELKILKERYGIGAIHFHDDNFMLNPERLKELCEKMVPLGLKWNCLARVDTVVKHPEVLSLMKQAGCVGVELGVESGDEKVYEKLHKQQKKDDVKQSVKMLKEEGLIPMYLMMSYCPGETIDSPYYSAQFLCELEDEKMTNFDYTKLTLMGHHTRASPGAAFYGYAEKEGLLLAKHWSEHFEENINFVPYSFLQSVPVKNEFDKDKVVRTLLMNKKNIEFFSKSIFYSTYNLIIKRFGSIKGFIKFMIKVYEECDGGKSVKDIAKGKDIRMLVSAISYLSILRLVKSNG